MKSIREIADQQEQQENVYIHRDLSWLAFNDRVIYQSLRWQAVPIMERLKFIGIASNNLDEFIMVRFASIINRIYRGCSDPEISGLYPEEELVEVYEGILQQKTNIIQAFHIIRRQMEERGMSFVSYKDLPRSERKELDDRFHKQIFPIISPIVYDTTKEVPLIHSKELMLAVNLQDRKNPNIEAMAMISLEGVPRIWSLSSEKKTKFIMVEDVVRNNLHRIFLHKKILSSGLFRIHRNADVELSHNRDEYLIDRMKKVLLHRTFSKPVMMEVSESMDKRTIKLLTKILEVEKRWVHKANPYIDLSFLMDFPHQDIADGYYEKFQPQFPQELIGERDIFSAIDDGDVIIQHPYESFEPVIDFLTQAANNPDVLAIRQTLYRVSSVDSPIVNALCDAARKGKQVYVQLEVKARFDEDQNISLIEKLKLSGCKIVYGIEGLKTHCKMIHVVKKTEKGVKMYCHIGTGNYNDKTAKIYTDLSYFTSRQDIGRDLVAVFNLLSGFSEPRQEVETICFSPYSIRYKINKLIEKEMKKGKKGYILLKMNSLSDQGIIDKLYEANDKGVTIDIICRGICSASLNRMDGSRRERFMIRSIVGRYLEHERIYVFGKGKKEKIFISSADMLTRNLDHRVELLIPIEDEICKEKIRSILRKLDRDTFNAFVQIDNGSYHKLVAPKGEEDYDAHKGLMKQAIKNYRLRTIPTMRSRR